MPFVFAAETFINPAERAHTKLIRAPKVILYSGNFGKIEVSWVYSVVLMKFCFSPKMNEGWTTKMTPVTTKRHKLTFKGVSLCLKWKCWDKISTYTLLQKYTQFCLFMM